FGYVAVSAFEAVALPYALMQFFPAINTGALWEIAGWQVTLGFALVGVASSVAITWINILGVRPAAFVQKVVTLSILFSGAVFLLGVSFNGTAENFEPWFVDGLNGVFVVLIMVPIMFVGFDVIPQAAEEIDLPFEVIGKLIVFSVIAAVLWYVLMILGVGLSLDANSRQAAALTTADASGAAWRSDSARALLIIGGIAGILTSWNAFLIGASRLVFALAGAGQLPRFLESIHPKYGTPYKALILLGALNCLSPWFGRPILVWLINAGSFGVIIAYVFVTASFCVLRIREPEMPRPYRLPFGKLIGFAALVLAFGMTMLFFPGSPAALAWPQEWAICFFWIALGAGLWMLSRKHNSVSVMK
ncbi:MAG: amino acid permease, partial [Pseudomonadota bacterium]